jgi:hypothetical protein
MLFLFTPKGMEMEPIQIMGMELEQSWIIAGGVGAILLIVIVWILVRRRSKIDGEPATDQSPHEEIRLTEPTLEPLPELDGESDTGDSAVEATAELAEEAAASEPPEPEVEAEAVVQTESEVEVEAGTEAGTEVEVEVQAEPDAEPDTETAEATAAAVSTDTPEDPPVSDPAFLAARETFEQELLGGNFSRLDVFEAYAQAQDGPDDPGIPRSEFFHRVVNRALESRDAYEILLTDQDREQFVDIHSRYLDDVTEEADADVRKRLHREHQEKLAGLRPKTTSST